MRFRLLGLPVKRLPYLFAQPYTGATAADAAHSIADAHQADNPRRKTESEVRDGPVSCGTKPPEATAKTRSS